MSLQACAFYNMSLGGPRMKNCCEETYTDCRKFATANLPQGFTPSSTVADKNSAHVCSQWAVLRPHKLEGSSWPSTLKTFLSNSFCEHIWQHFQPGNSLHGRATLPAFPGSCSWQDFSLSRRWIVESVAELAFLNQGRVTKWVSLKIVYIMISWCILKWLFWFW